LFIGCSKSGSGVLVPQTNTEDQPVLADLSVEDVHHALLGYGTVTYDPVTNTGSYAPNRDALMHLNIEPFLIGYCSNPSGCIRVGNFRPSPGGNTLIDVTVEHPFPSDDYSVFDLRVIAMMDVRVMSFPALGLSVSQAMVNADAYTSLWDNPGIPGDVNPYKSFNRFVSRRKFAAGTTVMETVEIKFPAGPLIFDIGVDASWAPKVGGIFPPEANSPEVVEMTTWSSGSLTPSGGSLTIEATVIDHQGYSTVWSLEMDCNGVFNGPWPMGFKTGDGTVATYTATISNTKGSPVGIYDVLIKVKDIEDFSNPLDICTYKIMKIVVGAEGGASSIQIIDPIAAVQQFINWGSGGYPNMELELTAVSIPPGAGVQIEWSFTDPDEPTSRKAADESSNWETDTIPNDNHGSGAGFRDGAGLSSTITTVTDGTGTSTVRFRTSTWAGDNYIIWAKRTTTQESASSPLITVWRKYLIRNDNMRSSGGTPGYYAPLTNLVNSESYEMCYMVLDIYTGPVQNIPYQSTVSISSAQVIINWCQSKTGFYGAIDTYQVVGVSALTGDAVGVAVPTTPYCLIGSGELNASYHNEVTAHEVAHLFGMNHVGTHSLMYPAVDGYRQMLRYQVTDLRNGPPLQPN
ncbi:MAG: hypothetical protein ABIG42_05945, partial [bacterium]